MSSTDTVKKDLHKTKWGNIEHLNLINYIDWKMNVTSILKSMKVWEIVTGEEMEPTETPLTHSTRVRSGEVDNANLQCAIENFKERRNDAETLLRFSVNNTIQKQLRCIEDPAKMWITLGNQFNRTYSENQCSIHASNLFTVKPRPGEHISTYCKCLLQYRDPVDGSDEEISDSVLLQHLFNNAGPMFTHTTHEVWKRKKTISAQDAIDELCEFERNHLANNQIGDSGNNTARTLLYSNGGRKSPFCKYCKKQGHHISDCHKKKAQEPQKKSSGNPSHARKDTGQTAGKKRSRDNIECWHCCETGHTEKDCTLKKRSDELEAAQNQKRFGKKGSVMVANGDNTEQSLVLRSNLD